MKIVFLTDWHSESMGYSDNYLPKELAKLGHEVHLVTSNRQVYFVKSNSEFYSRTLEPFLGPGFVEIGTTERDGVFIHRLDSYEILGRVFVRNLKSKLLEIKPDIVQSGDVISWQTYNAGRLKKQLDFSYYLECHTHASVFAPARGESRIRTNLYWKLFKQTVGKYLSKVIDLCYPISSDAARITRDFFGILPEKIVVRSLGVDCDIFKPKSEVDVNSSRNQIRTRLDLDDEDILCIYTGRLAEEKDPLILARAVSRLRGMGLPFKSLFIGGGPENYMKEIAEEDGSKIIGYVKSSQLPSYYQASDIAVWPRQESTSQLDALGCGLPLILGSDIEITERIEGNGYIFEQDSLGDLVSKLQMMSNEKLRNELGIASRKKALELFSWSTIAQLYETDYLVSLNARTI